MHALLYLYTLVLDALFPLSAAEQELFSISPDEMSEKLSPAPDFSGLVTPLPGARSVFAYKDERVAKLVWNIKYKKSARAVKMGGYALFQALNEGTTGAPAGKQISRDTPSASADAAASSQSPTLLPKCPSKSLSTGAPSSESHVDPASLKNILVIPIPITAQRRRERGYNQCELLLDEMERLAKEQIHPPIEPVVLPTHYGSMILEVEPRVLFEKNLLIRTQHAARQTLKGREDRVESAQGIFSVNQSTIQQLKKGTIERLGSLPVFEIPVIVIDDVITTGSTMHEAIETLKKAGFEDVRALSLAH